MTLDFTSKLGLISRLTNIDVYKIDDTYLQTYAMILAMFLL